MNSYQFSPGYAKIFTLNYNNDSYSDLILYNPSSEEISAVAGEKNESFTKENKFDFPFQISNLAPIREKNNEIKKYAFTSRKNLTAGICDFSSKGKPRVTNKLTFKYYPDKLSIDDIDGDFHQEILLSGSAFEGLSILSRDIKNLKEKKIITKGSYSDAIFIDHTNDGFPDIAAINLLNNSLELFFNDGRGNFKIIRTIKLDQKAGNLHTFDMNLDSYHDLIFVEGNKLKIMYGDFASSYSQQVEIKTKYLPSDFTIGDFNKDGRIDLTYLSSSASIVSVIYAETDFTFFHEIPILHRNGMKNIIPFYSKFIDGLAIIGEDGTLTTLTRLASLSSGQDVSLSIRPIAISYFDANSNAINDFCFIDSFDSSLKLIIRSNEGLPSTYFSIPLRSAHDNVEVINYSKESTTFFCFSSNKRLVEVIEADFKTGEIYRSEFYTARPIMKLKPALSNIKKVVVSSLVNNKLSIEIFEEEESWKLLTDYSISEKVISAELTAFRGINLFFWKQDDDSIKLFKKTFLPEELKADLMLKVKMKNISKLLTMADDFFNLEKESIISFVESNEKHYILVSYNQRVNIFDAEEVNDKLIVNDVKQLFVNEVKTNGTRRLIINNYNDQNIYRLNILRKGKRVSLLKMLDNINTRKYFVKNLTVNNFHFVYINPISGCISIRQI